MGKLQNQNVKQESVNIVNTAERRVPEGGWGWFACLAGFTAQFTILGIQNNSGILYTSLLTEFKGSKGDTAWVFSIGLGLMFLFCPITSSICERAGCRIVAIIGGLLGVLSFILSSFVKDLYVLYLTFGVLWGVGSSMTYLPSIMALPFWFRKRISVANGIVTAGSGFGTLAMGPLMHMTVTKLGWQNAVRVLAGVVLVCAISGGLYSVPKLNEKSMEKEKGEKPKKSLFEFSVLKNKAFLVWCVSLGVFMIGYFVPFVHLPGYAIECGVSNDKSATLVGMMSIGSTFGRLFFGKLCDHPKINRLYVFQLAFLFIGVAHTLSTLTKSYIGFVSYMVVFGVFDGCFVVLLGVLCADIVGYDKVAAGMGIQFFFMAITCTAGPPLAGLVYDLSASYQIAFYASGACATLGACLLFLIPILMPKEVTHEVVHLDDSLESSQNSEQRLIKSPISSLEDHEVTLRSGAARPCNIRNSFLEWNNLPHATSCSSFFGPAAPFGVLPSVNLNPETLLVVERVSQV